MCIGSNSVNQAQDLMTVTKIEDLPNSLLPTIHRGRIPANLFGVPVYVLCDVN